MTFLLRKKETQVQGLRHCCVCRSDVSPWSYVKPGVVRLHRARPRRLWFQDLKPPVPFQLAVRQAPGLVSDRQYVWELCFHKPLRGDPACAGRQEPYTAVMSVRLTGLTNDGHHPAAGLSLSA